MVFTFTDNPAMSKLGIIHHCQLSFPFHNPSGVTCPSFAFARCGKPIRSVFSKMIVCSPSWSSLKPSGGIGVVILPPNSDTGVGGGRTGRGFSSVIVPNSVELSATEGTIVVESPVDRLKVVCLEPTTSDRPFLREARFFRGDDGGSCHFHIDSSLP
jgi:hypothetical protein